MKKVNTKVNETVSIPQAVSTIAILLLCDKELGWAIVSIPQAVSTIAIDLCMGNSVVNTVSIPQAVSTIAIN